MKKKIGKDQLHADLIRPFFGFLAAANAHEVGMGSQGIRDAGAEAVGLNQDRHQLAQFRLRRSVRPGFAALRRGAFPPGSPG